MTRPKITTRIQAREAGLKHFFTGRPCIRGHKAYRLVSNKNCIACVAGKFDQRKAIRDKWRKNNRELINQRRNVNSKAHYWNNINKVRARTAVRDALNKGLLIKRPCKCGNTRVQAHHSDYSKPLKVIWLCSPCHRRIHARTSYG